MPNHLQDTQSQSSFEQWRKRAGFILAPLIFVFVYWASDALPPQGQSLAAILALTSTLWLTEAIPLPVSALLGAVLCIVMDVADNKTVLSYFADPIVFVFIGGFVLANAMSIHALDKRIALNLLSIQLFSKSPLRILIGLGGITAFLSMWISNSAATAMMMPIALGILRSIYVSFQNQGLPLPKTIHCWPFATGMMLMVAYSASIGGLGTPVGSPPNLIGIGQIKTATHIDISFFEWMAITLPIMVVISIALGLILWFLHPAGTPSSAQQIQLASKQLHQVIVQQKQHLGKWSQGEINTLAVFCFAITLWVLPGVFQLPFLQHLSMGQWLNSHLPESVVAILALVLLFVLPTNVQKGTFTITWQEAVQIDWGTILLFGGGLALGGLMFKTGVAQILGQGLVAHLGIYSLWVFTGIAIAMAIVLSEAASNTASANMMIPVVIAIAQAANIDPLPPALGACLGASFGFMLPVSTPPNAIIYSSGMVPLLSMMRAGVLLDIIGFGVIWGGLYLILPLINF